MDVSRNLSEVRSLVVKLGTQSLTDNTGRLDLDFLARIAGQVVELRGRQIHVTLVSSGAVGCGMRELGLERRPTDLPHLQAAAAVGQRRLMDGWADAFALHHLPVAQILLTREDINHRTRYLNLRNTAAALHEMGAVPIVNENDTVSTDELVRITFGDNDILAASVTHALRADLLVLLSVVDGLMDAQGQVVRMVRNVAEARQLVRPEKSALGKGGMDSKLSAAQMVADAGEAMVVADARMDRVLVRIVDGEQVGTYFAPAEKKVPSRRRWIGSVEPVGQIVVDSGAQRAVVDLRRSLLPAGVVAVRGPFERGDVVAVMSESGQIVARGLTNYAAIDMQRILGKKTQEVRQLLADAAYDEVIHCDNLVVG